MTARFPTSFRDGESSRRVAARRLDADRFSVVIGERELELRAGRNAEAGFWFVLEDGRRRKAHAALIDGEVHIRVDGHSHVLVSEEAGVHGASNSDGDPSRIVAPMTGTVTRMLVAIGDRVEEGDDLIVLSAMKMEHRLRAASPGVVSTLECESGANVEAGALLLTLEIDTSA